MRSLSHRWARSFSIRPVSGPERGLRRDGQRRGIGGGQRLALACMHLAVAVVLIPASNLLLCSAQDVTEGQAVVTALASALNGGQLDSAAFNAAVQRVTTLRAGLP
jgi:hypothetical protein